MNFSGDTLQTGFLYAISKLPISDLPEYKKEIVKKVKNNKILIVNYLKRDNQEKAIEVVNEILGLRL